MDLAVAAARVQSAATETVQRVGTVGTAHQQRLPELLQQAHMWQVHSPPGAVEAVEPITREPLAPGARVEVLTGNSAETLRQPLRIQAAGQAAAVNHGRSALPAVQVWLL
jgi:hypothetical protein